MGSFALRSADASRDGDGSPQRPHLQPSSSYPPQPPPQCPPMQLAPQPPPFATRFKIVRRRGKTLYERSFYLLSTLPTTNSVPCHSLFKVMLWITTAVPAVHVCSYPVHARAHYSKALRCRNRKAQPVEGGEDVQFNVRAHVDRFQNFVWTTPNNVQFPFLSIFGHHHQ